MLIAQISDLHVVEKNRHWLSEPLTKIDERVSKTISHLNDLNPRPDVVLLTGDATENGSKASYDHLKDCLQSLQIPMFIVPGNHDHREELRKVFSSSAYMPSRGFIHYAIEDFPVRLIGLDTLVQGENYGRICEERLEWFEKTLNQNRKKPTLIFMHHPPVKIGMRLFDQMNCSTPPLFENLIRDHDQIVGILTGHYHHLCISSFGGKLCFLAPSIAPVHHFSHPEADQVASLELEDPAVTLHRWQDDNALVSHVLRIKQIQRIDWSRIRKNP